MRTFLVLALILVLATLVLSLPIVQTKFAQYATNSINKEFGTHINIDKLRVSLITWETNLEKVYVEDYQKDTLFYINDLSTSILNLKNLYNGKLEFGTVDVDGLLMKMHTYKGEEDTNLDVFVDKLDDGKPRAPGTPPFFLSATHINIANSEYMLVDDNREEPTILDFTRLNISADDFQILGPEVSTDIKKLSMDSGHGVEISQMATRFAYGLEAMRFDSLEIKTPKSDIKGNLTFLYNREDFAEFMDKVKIEAQFTDSDISMDEINLFYNEFGSGKNAMLTTQVSGTLNDLHTEELFLQTDQSGIRGNIDLTNLFNDKGMVIGANLRNLTTSYYQLRGLMPHILGDALPSTLEKLGQFTARGTATITDTSIDSELNLSTAIGSSYSNLEITHFDDIDDATYKGFVSLIDFDLGDFANDSVLGSATLDFNVDGKGFDKENLNTEVIGKVYSLEYNGYEYKDVNVSGVLKDQLFDGSLSTEGPDLKFNFKGLADFSSERNNFNFIANVDHADLKALHFINDSISVFKGRVSMNMEGNNLDNVAGDISFANTSYQNNNETYYFEDFKVSSSFDADGTRTVEINSPDIITGYMKGYFKVNELGKLVQNSIGSIYTNYRPFKISEGQHVNFNFKIYNKIVEVFFPEVDFGPNTSIRGNIVSDDGDFKLNFKSPNIEAFGSELDSIDIKIDNKNPLFNTYVSIGDVNTPYYDVHDLSLINTTLNDTLFFRAEFKGGSAYNDSYNLNFYHTFDKKGNSVVGLKTSDVSFKGNKWVLNREANAKNKVIFNSSLDSILIEEVVMNNNADEQIRLRGQLADSTYKDLQLQFKLVSLEKISPAIDSLKLGGEVNGNLNILQKDGVYLPSCNLNIGGFSVNNMAIGDLKMGIVGNRDLTDYVVNTQITQNGVDKFSVIGNITNRNDDPQANLLADFRDFDMEPFSPLGDGVISHIRGLLNGNARITGPLGNPDINGLLTMNQAGVGVPYLNVDYDFANNSRVQLSGQTFHFDNVRLTDVAQNTHATLDGTISHQSFGDWNLDLNVDTHNERFMILNTDYDEEALYYGTGFINGTGRIYGPTDALTITVDGATAKGTSLKIPINDVATVGDYSFINFVEKGERQQDESQRILADYQGLEMEFNFDVTPDAEVEIVVDPKTGSSLKGSGEGLMLMEINTNGKFNMYGEFVVVSGKYRHRYGGIIDKTFTVRPGGNIYWDGSPLGAQLNMEAVYSLNANPAPLLDNSSYARRIPTDVVIRLTGELESPEIAFDIDFPGTNSIIKSELQYRLQDPTVEERNAFFLLAQGTFANDESSINQQALTGNLIQTGTGLLNQMLGVNNDKLNLGFSYEQGMLDKNADIQTENRIGVTVSTQISDKVLLNGRLGVPVGGVSESVVAGDVEVQILLNEEGTLSAKIFNRENEIQQFLADRQGYTQGVGLSYEVDFNNFKELIQHILGQKNVSQPAPAAKEEAPKEDRQVMGKDSLIQFYSKKESPANQ